MKLFNAPESIDIADIISAWFYTIDLTRSPICISADGKYFFELRSNENWFIVEEGSLKKVQVDKNSTLELEIEWQQLGKWAAWAKWLNTEEESFIPRQFQKKLTSLEEISAFFQEIYSIRATERYRQEVERIFSTM
jgi:hypothetical protein